MDGDGINLHRKSQSLLSNYYSCLFPRVVFLIQGIQYLRHNVRQHNISLEFGASIVVPDCLADTCGLSRGIDISDTRTPCWCSSG